MTFNTALHGDVVGYSALIADNESETVATLRSHRSIIETVVMVRDGQMASFTGDEFLSVFRAPRDAVLAAIQIQRELAAENLGLPVGRQMRFRLGVHTGELHQDEGNWYGDVVNIAARLQAQAEPGGVLISDDALEGAGDLEVRVVSDGAKRLKNIPEPVMSYRLLDDELPTVGGRLERREQGRVPSLAVLRFLNLGSPQDEHVASGLMMSLIIGLMTIPGLDVISENSVLALGEEASAMPESAARIGARYVLEGAVQRDGDQIRVMTQLIDSETSRAIWADQFESNLEGLFATQDDLVGQIVAAIEIEGLPEFSERARIYRDELDGPTVELVYKAWQAFIEGTPEGVRRARGLFEEVSGRVPHSATGWSEAAWTYLWETQKGWSEDVVASIAKAKELALTADELGDPTGFASAVLAYVHLFEKDWDGAYEAAKKATAERPSCDVTFGVAASVMRYLGRWEEAVEMGQRATRLSPLLNDWYQSTVASAYFVGRDYESATAAASSVVAIEDHDTEALLTLAASEAAMGRKRHAAAALRQAREAEPKLSTEALRSTLLYKDDATREEFLDRLHQAGLD